MYTIGSIRISVNDASESTAIAPVTGSLFCSDDCFSPHGEPLRAARSLSRLDVMLKAEQLAAAAAAGTGTSVGDEFDDTDCILTYRCGSFPRIDREAGCCTSLQAAAARAYLDTDSMSPRLSNATLSQDLDGELLALSVVNLGLPPTDATSSVTSGSGHATSLTRSASARTVRAQASNGIAGIGGCTSSGVYNGSRWVHVSGGTASSSEHSIGCRVFRSASCPCISTSSPLARSTSSAFGFTHLLPLPPGSRGARKNLQRRTSKPKSSSAATAAKMTAAPGRGRPYFDADIDLHSERVTDLPVDVGPDIPDFVPERQLAASNVTINCRPPDHRIPSSSVRRPLSSIEVSSTSLMRHLAGSDDHVTISELPVASRHVSLYRPFRQRPPQLVEFKCIRWLQSLDMSATDR